MSMIDDIKRDREAGTPGPWSGHNMTHEEGRPMTPEDIGEYVSNSVKMGDAGRFLFVSGKHSDGGDCDVCHTGNGPNGMANTARIARVPDMEAALLAAEGMAEVSQRAFDWIEMMEGRGNSATSVNLRSSIAAYRKATGADQ